MRYLTLFSFLSMNCKKAVITGLVDTAILLADKSLHRNDLTMILNAF